MAELSKARAAYSLWKVMNVPTVLRVVLAYRDQREQVVELRRQLRDDVVNSFQRGDQPVILCPARGLTGLRIGRIPRRAVKEGRLLILSPFAENIRRTTAAQAVRRNDLVAALAEAVWVPHASSGGKTWVTVRALLDRRQPIFAFNTKDNRGILEAGARPFAELDVPDLLGRNS